MHSTRGPSLEHAVVEVMKLSKTIAKRRITQHLVIAVWSSFESIYHGGVLVTVSPFVISFAISNAFLFGLGPCQRD